MTPRTPKNPRRALALVLAVAASSGLTGWWVGTTVQSPADAAAGHQPPPASAITVPVERRVLTSTVIAQGNVVYAGQSPLILTGLVASPSTTDAGAASTQLITKAPSVGTTLKAGAVLLEISGRPVFVLQGSVPMYRTMGMRATGDDVRQLQAAMRALGYGKIHGGIFDASTADAVNRLYHHAGYEAQQPDDEQRHRLTTLQQAVKHATNPQTKRAAQQTLTRFQRTYGISIPAGEIIFLPKLPARLNTVTARAGAAATGQIGTVTNPDVVIQATLPTADTQLVHTRLPATLTMNDGTTVGATLVAMGKDAIAPPSTEPLTADSNADPSAQKTAQDDAPSTSSTPLRLTARRPAALAPYAGQDVKVSITVGTTSKAALVVPIAAVVTSADGKARVQVQRAGHLTDVTVTLGLTALGLVTISADDGQLAAGDRVVVGVT